MLYIASALESSAVTHSILVPSFTSSSYDPESSSLVVAKGKIIEVWDARPEGLVKVCETDVWGIVVGLCWVGDVEAGQQPHIVVLTDHPLTRLLLYCYTPPQPPASTGSLSLTSHHWIDRLSRTAEFLTTLISEPASGLVIASLYAGILSVVEVSPKRPGEDDEDGMEVELDVKKITPSKRNGKGKRKESLVAEGGVEVEAEGDGQGVWGPMTFREKHDVNVREHNLLSMAFINASSESSSLTSSKPLLAFLYLTPDYDILLIARSYDRTTRSFKDRSATIDVRSPTLTDSLGGQTDSPGSLRLSGDFSVPAAKQLLALPRGEGVLVVGDEYSAAYSLVKTRTRSTSGSNAGMSRRESMNMSTASASSAGRVSPELKRRKASVGGSFVPGAGGNGANSTGNTGKPETKDAYTWKRGIRYRQGFGEVSGLTAIPISATTSAVFVGDSAGRLTMVTYEKGSASSSVTYPLGITSSPSSLTYLDNGYLFVASICGDSHVIRIRSRSLAPAPSPSLCLSPPGFSGADAMQIDEPGPSSGKAFDIVDTWTNIAPIRDLCVVRQDGNDDSQIVTASGLAPSGSLRVIKSGVGTEELAVIEGIVGVTAIFPIGSSEEGDVDTALLISTATSTRYLRLEGEDEESFSVSELASTELYPFSSEEGTLAAGLLSGSSIIQITRTVIRVLDTEGRHAARTWRSSVPTLHACLLPGLAVIALEGGAVKLFEVSADQIRELSEFVGGTFEIASLDATLLSNQKGGVIAVGSWGDNTVRMLSIPTLRQLNGTIGESTLPASLHFGRTASGISLSIGSGDGSLATYAIEVDLTSEIATASRRKDMSLGRSPVTFSPRRMGVREDSLLITTGDRTSIVFAEQDRLSCSALGSRDVSSANIATSRALGEVLVIASSTGLSLLRITSLKNLHIRKVDLGSDGPVGVAHDSRSGTYGVAINRVWLESGTGEEVRSSCLRLYEDVGMTHVSELAMESGEEIVSLARVAPEDTPYFAVTTVFPDRLNDAGSASAGGIKLYTVDVGVGLDVPPSLRLVAKSALAGTVYDVKSIWGCLAVAVDHRVVLYKLDLNDASTPLRQLSEWGNSMFASCLTVQSFEDPRTGKTKERLHVGDGMRSVFSVELGSDDTMVDVGRDMRPHWIVSMAELAADDGAVIFADTSYNVLTIKHANNRMENAAALALHEVVTKFEPGSIVPASAASVKPELLFATSSGRLGVIADLGSSETKLLGDLQRNMEGIVTGPGLDWRRYREVHTEGTAKPRQTAGFIDGDFVKRFLSQTTAIDAVMRGQNDFTRITRTDGQVASRDDVVKSLELVSALH